MYKIHPSVYENADPALLELIERAQVCNLSDDELIRYDAGLKAFEDTIDFDEMLAEAKVEMQVEINEAKEEANIAKKEAEAIKTEVEAVKKEAEVAKNEAKRAKEKLAEVSKFSLEEGRTKGQVEGIAIGKKQNQRETAKRMLKLGMDIDTIVEISKLTVGEIEKLR